MSAAHTPMMECGHAANAQNGKGEPSCVICVGIHPGAEKVVANPPDLSKRTARCSYYGSVPTGRSHEGPHGCERGKPCMCERPSSSELAFFSHKADKPHDDFYCGCWGWD